MKLSMLWSGVLLAAYCCLFAPLQAQAEQVNLLALQEGCLPVVVPPNYGGWEAENMLDESARSGWASEKGRVANNVFVFEMPVEATLEKLQFDTAGIDTAGSAAKEITVEISKTSANDNYTTILRTNLTENKDGQIFLIDNQTSGRWVRLTIINNYGSASYCELFSFKGFGEKPRAVAFDAISGTFSTDYSSFHVLQQGTALSGCYEYDGGLLDGAIDGRVMKITWREDGGPEDTGPAIMVFAEDGRTFRGFWWNKGRDNGPPSGRWNGTRVAKTVGSCPHWSGSMESELKKQLDTTGRARIYGIRFALDSAQIESESLPILGEVLAVLQQDAGLKLSIEGHTDSTGSAAHNQTLSQQRAESVRIYLVDAGIAAGRLTAMGFGASSPVANNATELGRAQNRRVELDRK